MKKLLLTLFSISATVVLMAQPTLKHDSHRLLAGADNPMTICDFMEAGISGEKISWDFSKLKAKSEFTGLIKQAIRVDKLTDANTQLVEFGTNFFFDIDENGIKQVGYASNDLKTVIEYTEPFIKMKYPFSFGDSYTTNFSGNYYYDTRKVGDITGIGDVEADAYGTLLLPNNKVYEDVIRVKTSEYYTVKYSETSSNDVEIITYRWYNSGHRYPLLVLTEYTTVSGGNSSTSFQAAYNNNAVQTSAIKDMVASNDLLVYPNPAERELYLDMYSNNNQPAYISIYDVTGKIVVSEKEKSLVSGNNTLNLSGEIMDLKTGNYFLNVRFSAGQTIIKEISVLHK